MPGLEEYLRELRDIRSTGAGVKETSYYPALSNLLNEIGKALKPRVRCILQLANRGSGSPDGACSPQTNSKTQMRERPSLDNRPAAA